MPASTESSRGSTASVSHGDGAAIAELVGARKNFGHVEALRGVDFTLRQGELVGLLGPNGAGKTTAISLLLGLRRPTSGSATLFGLDPRDLRARSRTGVMLQESGIPLTLKVREIVALFSSYYPAPLPVERVVEMADLGEFAEKLTKDLSGGQRQRVYFALAVCGDPEVLFLDEPTVGLDPATRRSFWEQVRSFKAMGKSILLTTHYLEEADALADRVVVIDHGLVIAEGTPEELRSRVPGKKVSFVSPGIGRDAFAGLAVGNLEVDDGRVSALTADAEGLLRLLFQRGVPIADLEVSGAGLEEAVLALTGGR
jgi:ABC-2 type transport system ATP-binding protein